MMSIVIDAVVVLGILYCAWLGSDKGLFPSLAAGLLVFTSLACAIVLHEVLADIIGNGIVEAAGALMPMGFMVQKWFGFLLFVGIFWGLLVVLWVYVMPLVTDAELDTLPLIDTFGGAIAGGFSGLLFIGSILITASITPFVPFATPTVDIGRTALRTAGRFAGDFHDGRSLVLYGEPATRDGMPLNRADRDAQLTNESWFDANGTGLDEKDDADPFYDANGDGIYTKDLYYLDLDGDGVRRIGLLEKYTVGSWDWVIAKRRSRDEPVKKTTPSPTAPTTSTVGKEAPRKRNDNPLPADATVSQSVGQTTETVSSSDFLSSLTTEPMTTDAEKPETKPDSKELEPKSTTPVIDF